MPVIKSDSQAATSAVGKMAALNIANDFLLQSASNSDTMSELSGKVDRVIDRLKD